MPTETKVTLMPGAEENGLACMLSELLKENLEKPSKRRLMPFIKGRVGIVAQDAEVSLTLDFSRGTLRIYDGLQGVRDLTITTNAEKITGMSLLNLKFGLPVYHDAAGRAVLKDLLSGALKIEGLHKHPILLTLLTILMSVNG